ncbi:MAG: hypothetical protein ACXVEF_34430 [Polyangiales bacterium]
MRTWLAIVIWVSAPICAVACSREGPTQATTGPNESPALASVGRQLANVPVPTVPLARGGGPTVGTVSVDEARARLSNARCKVNIACGRDDDLDACTTREAASLDSISACSTIESARLDACVSEITLRGCLPTIAPECTIEVLCAR